MGASVGGNHPIKRHAYPQNAEMNVTPFVDVMLVLLIIFMVAAPLATVSVPVDLPPASDKPAPPPADPIYISLQKDGSLFVGEQRTSEGALLAEVARRANGNKEQRIFIRCDQRVVYGEFMSIMNRLQDAGYDKVGLVAEEQQK